MPMLSTLSTLLKTGRYSELAMLGDTDRWEVHAARAMIGMPERAIEPLGRFDGEGPRFFQAAASWMAGDAAAARALSRRLETPLGNRLAELVGKDRIDVLCQLPANRHGPHVHLTGAAADPVFRIANISHHPDDLPLRPGASIWEYADRDAPPDLFLCEMVEWHQIPADFQELPCPLIGATSDFDMHIQGIQPWLNGFDVVVVNDHTEYASLRSCIKPPMAVFPLLFGCPSDLPVFSDARRDIDVFMSGTLFAPYHPDKAALLHSVIEIPDLNVVLVNGHMPETAYFDFLSRSKLTVSYYRRPGGMVTRGIEAVCMGCVVLLQEGSVLTLYAPDSHGIVSYDSTPAGLVRAIVEALPQMPRLQRQAAAAVDHFRSVFAGPAVASRFLRSMAVTSVLFPPAGRPASSPLVQKRNMFWKGWQPGGGNLDFADRLAETNIARWAELSPDGHVNDQVRETLLASAAAAIARKESEWDESRVAPALDRLGDAAAKFPQSLVLGFNYVRCCLHFGTAEQQADAVRRAVGIVARDERFWRVDPLDDVYPYDFCSDHFNYRSYLDLVTSGIEPDGVSWRGNAGVKAVRFLIASINHYLALVLDSTEHAARAWELDPAFPPYLLDFAFRCCRQSGDLSALAPALAELVRNSAFAPQAMELLRFAEKAMPCRQELAELEEHMRKYSRALLENDSHLFKVKSAYFKRQILGSIAGFGAASDGLDDYESDGLSIILVGETGALCLEGEALGSLGQAIRVFPFGNGPAAVHPVGSMVVNACQTTPLLHLGRCMNIGLSAARSRWVALFGSADPVAISTASLRQALDAAESSPLPRVAIALPDGNGGVAALICRRIDALLCGGLEAHQGRFGMPPDLVQLTWRLCASGVRLLGEHPSFPQPAGPAAQLWPGLFSAARRRRPHLEDVGLVPLGLRLLFGSHTGDDILSAPGGIDLLYHLDRGLNSHRIDDGLGIEKDYLADTVLVSKKILIMPGSYRVELRIRSDVEIPVSKILISTYNHSGEEIEEIDAAVEAGCNIVKFDVPSHEKNAERKSIYFKIRVIHLGVADWEITELRVMRKGGLIDR